MENPTFWIAIYGAVLSSILALFKYLEFRKNRPIIKVSVSGGWQPIPTTSFPDKTIITIKAVNIGHRPITISGAGLLGTKKGFLMCADTLSRALTPVELTENRSKEYYMGETTVKNEHKLTPDKYIAYVYDVAGRIYYSHNIFQRFIKLGRLK